MGRSCLDTAKVSGCKRVPDPPASMIPFMVYYLSALRYNFKKTLRYNFAIAKSLRDRFKITQGPMFWFSIESFGTILKGS